MTTIAYHGPSRTICSDSLVTRGAGAAKVRNESAVKVECLKRLKLPRCKGEKLLALAYCGTMQRMEDATRFILHNFKSWRGAEELYRREGLSLDNLNNVSMLLITDKKAYCFNFANGRLEFIPYELDAYVTIGSGCTAAITAMKVYGATARDALVAAALIDDSTGVIVHTHRITKDGLIYDMPEVISTGDQTRIELRNNAAASTVMPKLRKPAPGEPITSILSAWTDNSETVKQIRENLKARDLRDRKKRETARKEKQAQREAKKKKEEASKPSA
ncbi:hypothetical protein [Xanthomonas phage RTH11]|nr:hypothetical protein [Xanthomonas phage RTH11]